MPREFHIEDNEHASVSGSESEVKKEDVVSTDPIKQVSEHKHDLKKIIIAASVALFLAIVGIFAFFIVHGNSSAYAESNNGAMIVGVDNSMTDADIYSMLADQATSMKIHVWQAPAINGNVLSLGFENSADNKYDQAFRVIQNDKVIYESYPVAPGKSVKDVDCSKARVGKAIIEIFNVVNGSEYGNGVRCEVVIIGTDNDGNKADRVEDVTGAASSDASSVSSK